MPQSQSYQDFSAQIKARYPEYRDVDDFELASRVVAKYPHLANQVSFSKADLFNRGAAPQVKWDDAPTGDIFDQVSSQPQKPPPFSRSQADQFMTDITTRGMGQWHSAAGPSFAQSFFIDPTAKEVGGRFVSGSDLAGNFNPVSGEFIPNNTEMVESRQVGAARQALKAQSDTRGKVLSRQGALDEGGGSPGDLTLEGLQYMPEMYGDIGANLGEKAVRLGAKYFQDDSQATPGEIAIARATGRFGGSFVTDPTNLALGGLSVEGRNLQNSHEWHFCCPGSLWLL